MTPFYGQTGGWGRSFSEAPRPRGGASRMAGTFQPRRKCNTGQECPAYRILKPLHSSPSTGRGILQHFRKVEDVLTSKVADFVSMFGSLIRQPDLPVLWRSGEGSDKAECISYNVCLPIGAARMTCRLRCNSTTSSIMHPMTPSLYFSAGHFGKACLISIGNLQFALIEV